ncbi:hypothetical protein BA190_09360 [Labrys sp. WJW]|uniref:DUF4815 domain-containing protein n=1 Tax=Labrys sp. WJW TaxID=1737983 RepID=UPI0008328189|nr:DUF4815 domain-containing protein [Labrys sp. WJW]OCC05113.1 hypothetical protein BA190_09360 [Labrys sp. WJW]
MPFEVAGAPPMTYDRAPANPNWSRALFSERSFVDGATFNEGATMEMRRNQRVANMTARDGDRQTGCDIIVDAVSKTVTLSSGTVFVNGDVRPVGAAIFHDVPMTGDVQIGVRLQTTTITHEDDPSLRGLGPGTEAENEPIGARVIESLVWALENDNQPGAFYQVYFLQRGTVIDQTPPSALSGIQNLIAGYDYGLAGHYIVSGNMVQAIGNRGEGQVFSIAAGEANILGYKKIRYGALPLVVPEEFDVETVAAETSMWTSPTGGQHTITVQRPPIAAVSSVVIVKRTTQSVVRGPVPGGTDALQFSSVVAIEQITQGATTFAGNTDYVLSNGNVSWAPGGAEPAAASTYSVTYLYNSPVLPDEVTPTTIKVTGGVNGQPVLVFYTSKLPRVDLVCLDRFGLPVYVKGISTRQSLMAPQPPYGLLKLAEVTNTWMSLPVVNNNGTRRTSQDEIARMKALLFAVAATLDRQASLSKIAASSPVAKRGIFTDNFTTDFYRDQGAPQTAAVNRGVLQLAVDLIEIIPVGNNLVTLPYTEEVVISQPIASSSMKINPHANFNSMPAELRLEPNVDYWKETVTNYLSPITQEFVAAPGQPPGEQTLTVVEDTTQETGSFIREIPVKCTINGFGAGENLATLTFAGIDVKPAGTQTADGNGVLVVNITVPPNIPVGTSRVRATGAADTFAEALYVGNHDIDVVTARMVTLISRDAPPPVTIINNITNVTNVVRTTTVVRTPNTSINTGSEPTRGGSKDPLAQSFAVPEPRQIIGLNFKFTEIGNRAKGVRVQLATMDNGEPTQEVMAEAFINMNTVTIGVPVKPRFGAPIYLVDNDLFCNVILTDDAEHAVAIAKLGDVDPVTQQRIAAQPYTIGDLFSSSNRASWLVMLDADHCFEEVAAKYTSTTLTVELWAGDLDQVSDITIRGTVDIPTEDARFHFEFVRATGEVIALMPGQTWSFAEYVTEHVKVRAVLEGSTNISPILYPGVQIICGRIRPTGTYITKAWAAGNPVTLDAVFAKLIPAGSGATIEMDNSDGVWVPVPEVPGATQPLGDGWTEPAHQLPAFTGLNGRLKITLNGGPSARPSIADLRAFTH